MLKTACFFSNTIIPVDEFLLNELLPNFVMHLQANVILFFKSCLLMDLHKQQFLYG